MKNYRMGFYEVKLFSSNIPLLVAVPFFFLQIFPENVGKKCQELELV